MKLKNKIFIIFFVFFVFLVFNEKNSFASQQIGYKYGNINYCSNSEIQNIINNAENLLDDYYNSYFIIEYCDPSYRNSHVYCIVYNNTNIIPIFNWHGAVDSSNNSSTCMVGIESNNRTSFNYKELYHERGTANYSTTPYSVNNSSSDYCYRRILCSSNGSIRPYMIHYSSDNIYLTDSYFVSLNNYRSSSISSGELLYLGDDTEPPSTIHDLFELNLTDKNMNDLVHTFILNTDEEFSNYDELMDYIENENKYCIYITEYTRLLTFEDNSWYSPLVDGHYLLSGYIDFLISDNAYFYFSPHFNRIKVCSGDYRGQDMTTYTKRFFFTLVASEDSEDTYFTIQDDNGLLWSLSDYVNDGNTSTSDIMQDIANSYFVGSNQIIYYAVEDSNYILDSLTNDIYYGKDRLSDDRIYNFGFSGGNFKEFYLSEATFDDDVSDYNDYIEDSKDNHDVIYDNTNGNSSIVPQDETTYTYSQDNQNNPQNERLPYTSNNEKEDTSNWSIWDFFKGIFDKLGNLLSAIGNLVSDLTDAFIRLFVPSADFFANLFDDMSEWFELKLRFLVLSL